jgi:hypothetical protein
MQKGPLRAIARVIFWRFRRGSWQYDILCGLILVFIFLTPKSVFDGSFFSESSEKTVEQNREKEVVEEKKVDSETQSEGVGETEIQLQASE